MRVRIGEDIDAIVPFNRAGFSAGVTREACVAYRIQVASAHMLAYLKARRHFSVPPRGMSLSEHWQYHVSTKWRSGPAQIRGRSAPLPLGAGDQAALDQQFD